jgi:amino acid transporter
MLQLVTVVSILGNTIASHNAVVRIQYGMGRARALPSPLGWTHRKFKTPYVAILVQTGLSLAITLFAGLYWGATKSFGFLGFLIGLAAAIAFILILIAALRYFPRERPQDGPIRNYLLPIIGIVILAPVVYTSFYPDPGYPLKWAPYVILGWLIAGIGYLGWRESRREHIDIDYAFREIGEAPPDSASQAEPA